MSDYKKITRCRVSGSSTLIPILNLGEQVLTGVFPRSQSEQITSGPLELVWNPDCGLVQLNHSYSLSEMYGDNYGYRSGLNKSMVEHLRSKVFNLQRRFGVSSGDTERAMRVARRVRTGTMSVNGGMSIMGDLPFGGMKGSGVGREWGLEGIEEFLDSKVIAVRL